MKRRKNNSEEVSYWQSTADVLCAFLFIILLVLALLLLIFVTKSLENNTSNSDNVYKGVKEIVETTVHRRKGGGDSSDETTKATKVTTRPIQSGGGGGQGEYPEEGETEGGNKSAVYVVVYDGETEKNILQSDITFELYNNKDLLQTLYTYYPEKIAYNSFATKKDGTFYLPEKIVLDDYYFKQISEIKGYDNADNVWFKLNEEYDWSNAYVVKIPVYPAKNIVRVSMIDTYSKNAVTGGSFELIAAEDITTVDGTVRYKSGEIVDELICDENGYAESIEVYLGKYYLRQKDIPFGYAGILGKTEVEVDKKSDETGNKVQTFECEKTQVILYLNDEISVATMLTGATYKLTCDKDTSFAEVCKTDDMGRIIITDLEKNCTYHLNQIASVDEYAIDKLEHSFTVDETGRVDEEIRTEMMLTNRIIRAKFDVSDAIIRIPLRNHHIELYDDKDKLIKEWTTSEISQEIEGIEPGNYYILCDGGKRKDITIQDIADVQKISFTLWSIYGFIAGFIILVILIAAAVIMYKKIIKNKLNKKSKNIT
ncbi:MAG: hypothetical protein MJ089_06225 [Ruminococcus sp.]|nr:hypothetical protein [Ruminococcus sp.]